MSDLHPSLIEAARRNDVATLHQLAREGADIKANDSAALYWAAENQAHQALACLIPLSRPRARCSRALQAAARQGDTRGLSLLLPVSDSGLAMRQCLKDNHWRGVDNLLIHVDRRWQMRALGRAASLNVRLPDENKLRLVRALEGDLPPVQRRPTPRL